MHLLLADFFNVDFGRGVVMIFLGVAPAFLVRLAATWAWDECRVKPAAERAKRARQIQLLEAIRDTTKTNNGLIDTVLKYTKADDGVPYFNFDLTVLDGTSSIKWELLDAATCEEIDGVRYELSHAARKVDGIFKAFSDPRSRTSDYLGDPSTYPPGEEPFAPLSMYRYLRWHFAKSLNEHLPDIKMKCSSLQSLLNNRIHELKSTPDGKCWLSHLAFWKPRS